MSDNCYVALLGYLNASIESDTLVLKSADCDDGATICYFPMMSPRFGATRRVSISAFCVVEQTSAAAGVSLSVPDDLRDSPLPDELSVGQESSRARRT